MNILFDKTLRLLSITVLVGTLFISCSNENNERVNTHDNSEKDENVEDILSLCTLVGGATSSSLK